MYFELKQSALLPRCFDSHCFILSILGYLDNNHLICIPLELKIQFTLVSKHQNTAPAIGYITHAREQTQNLFYIITKSFKRLNFTYGLTTSGKAYWRIYSIK